MRPRPVREGRKSAMPALLGSLVFPTLSPLRQRLEHIVSNLGDGLIIARQGPDGKAAHCVVVSDVL